MALREPRPAPYRLRPATPFDLDEVARIESESFPVPWKREFFASELSEPHRYIRVLAREDGGEPRVGGYLFAVSLYDEFHINKIATDLRLRRLGHGRRLLEDALGRAGDVGSSAITLEVRVSNDAARGFYRSYGFAWVITPRAIMSDPSPMRAVSLPTAAAGMPSASR